MEWEKVNAKFAAGEGIYQNSFAQFIFDFERTS